MHLTIFTTPVLKSILRLISIIILKIIGWKTEGKRPDISRFVMIAAPHTSNWDFLYTVLIAFYFDLAIHWMGKESIFKRPFGAFMKWMGGVPVNRSRANNLVEIIIKKFESKKNFIILIPPEGTRGKVSFWKTGFYHIATGAGVPIVLGYLNYGKKTGGLGPIFFPTGDINIDMEHIRSYYADIQGKHRDKYSSTAAIAGYKKKQRQIS